MITCHVINGDTCQTFKYATFSSHTILKQNMKVCYIKWNKKLYTLIRYFEKIRCYFMTNHVVSGTWLLKRSGLWRLRGQCLWIVWHEASVGNRNVACLGSFKRTYSIWSFLIWVWHLILIVNMYHLLRQNNWN